MGFHFLSFASGLKRWSNATKSYGTNSNVWSGWLLVGTSGTWDIDCRESWGIFGIELLGLVEGDGLVFMEGLSGDGG